MGLAIAGVAGLILAIPFGISYELNYVKLGVKFLILIVIGALLGIGAGPRSARPARCLPRSSGRSAS